MPQRTRLFFPSPQLLYDPKVLAQTIYERTFTRLKRKQAKQPYSHHLQCNSSKNVSKSLSKKIHMERGI